MFNFFSFYNCLSESKLAKNFSRRQRKFDLIFRATFTLFIVFGRYVKCFEINEVV